MPLLYGAPARTARTASLQIERIPDVPRLAIFRLPDDDGGDSPTDSTATMSEVVGAPPARPPTSGSPATQIVTVTPGDSLWSLSAAALGSDADEATVTAFWLETIEQNRGVLVDPANPDLIYPGQVFTLPPRS